MNNVVSALTAAGARRRAMTNGSDDFEYQRERQAEIESEKIRQQRIRDKIPGRKPTRPRAGDIDGMYMPCLHFISSPFGAYRLMHAVQPCSTK
jgi:exocyst complex component 4